MPIWNQVYRWSLFPFDAAGLLTLLGAEEINLAVGRLVRSRYLEFMPLLAPFVITGNRFTKKIAGYRCYNVTDGINLEIESGWLARYLVSHEENTEIVRSILKIKVLESPRNAHFENLCALLVSGLFFGTLFTLTILAGDWWGLGSTIGVAVSVLVRIVLLEANRNSIDESIERDIQLVIPETSAIKKVLVVTPDNKCLTILIPGHLIIPILGQNPRVRMPRGYKTLRYAGWIAFISHIIAINQACFAVRVITTVSLVVGTIFYSWKVGCTDSTWFWQRWYTRFVADKNATPQSITTFVGTRLKLELTEWPSTYEFVSIAGIEDEWRLINEGEHVVRSDRRADLYAWLNLTDSEEESVAKWDLFPHLRMENETWWDDYNIKKHLISENGLDLLALYTDPIKDKKGTLMKKKKVFSQLSATGNNQWKSPKRTSTILIEGGTAI